MKKTIKQIADELGVSKQAVQKRLSREPLCTSIQPYISTVGGIKYIDVVGENLIKSAFAKNNRQPNADNLSTYSNDVPIDKNSLSIDKNSLSIDKSVVDVVIDVLKTQIETLQSQLEVKDKQIEQLRSELAEERQHSREQSDKLSVIADQAQKLQLAQMNMSDMIEDKQEPKRHWWQRKG